MDITGGTLIIDDNVLDTVLEYRDNGLITAYGGAGTLLADYDDRTPGKTTVTAIPEPATIDLLGLGGLASLVFGAKGRNSVDFSKKNVDNLVSICYINVCLRIVVL